MQVVSDQLRSTESAQEAAASALPSPTRSLNEHRDEFPARVSTNYDPLLRPAFVNRPRKRFKRFAAIGTLLLLAFIFSSIEKFPSLTSALEVALAIAAFSIVLPLAFSLLGGAGAPVRNPISEKMPKPLRDRNDVPLQAPIQSSSI
jgi:hypothetical protein